MIYFLLIHYLFLKTTITFNIKIAKLTIEINTSLLDQIEEFNALLSANTP